MSLTFKSIFLLSLNLAPPAAPAGPLLGRNFGIGASIMMSEAAAPKNTMISIVDDDPSVREGTMDLLNAMGFITETFQHADDFLQADRLHGTSCLIADVHLPGMSGLELYDHLVGSGNFVPTILITAFPDEGDRLRALQAGVFCYLAKPFKESELLACIQSALACGRTDARGS
jgi:FixJ family two-component response regulator